MSVEEGLDVDNDLLAHIHATFQGRRSRMGKDDDPVALQEFRVYCRFMFKHVEAAPAISLLSTMRASAFSSITSPRAVLTT